MKISIYDELVEVVCKIFAIRDTEYYTGTRRAAD